MVAGTEGAEEVFTVGAAGALQPPQSHALARGPLRDAPALVPLVRLLALADGGLGRRGAVRARARPFVAPGVARGEQIAPAAFAPVTQRAFVAQRGFDVEEAVVAQRDGVVERAATRRTRVRGAVREQVTLQAARLG